MKEACFLLTARKVLAPGVQKLTFGALPNDPDPLAACPMKPGQFVNLALPGLYLRRPFSVYDCAPASFSIVFKVVGRGTALLAELPCGSKLDLLIGLGNGFDLSLAGARPLLVGGGMGLAPLYYLAKTLRAEHRTLTVIAGFNTASEVFGVEALEALGARVVVTTRDGSRGLAGLVTDAMGATDPTCLYACGPEAMLRAVYDAFEAPGQFSFEERMGCGFGACLSCSCQTLFGAKRLCKDGPVLTREEILWKN